MHDIYIGIDNGISGALAALNKTTGALSAIVMPTVEVRKNNYIDDRAVRDWILAFENAGQQRIYVVYEQGQKQPMFGCKTNFAQGYSFGVIATIMSQNNISCMAVNPKDWQKPIFTGIRGDAKDTKGASIEFVRRTYPTFDMRPTARSKNPHDGIADSVCIATWAARQNL